MNNESKARPVTATEQFESIRDSFAKKLLANTHREIGLSLEAVVKHLDESIRQLKFIAEVEAEEAPKSKSGKK